MSYTIKDNTFSLFENDKKGNDKSPDFKGKGMVDGKEVRVAVWKRTSKTGVEYLSGSIEEVFVPQIDAGGNPAVAFLNSKTKEPEVVKEEPIAEAVADEIPF
jgi:uncharacterized protein (DUF736 family)